ncbi:MAG: ArdC family protein [Phycisphaerae bacterium]|nr:ArdC family protein [Phycisphaerae bacterium]
MARFHQYSFGNCTLLAMQRPDATRVAGFNRWKELGRFVKAGEKGVVIIASMLIRKLPQRVARGDKSDDSNGGPTADEAAEKLRRFKAVYVFDVSQTDGPPLPELHRVGGNPQRRHATAQGFHRPARYHARIRRRHRLGGRRVQGRQDRR